MKYYAGLDIGGTKCAALIGGVHDDGTIEILAKEKFPTAGKPEEMLEKLCEAILRMKGDKVLTAAGISCGGPLSSEKGLILSPPNLPGWDEIPACKIVGEKLNIPCKLQNDADACALAEWKFGAGKGTDNMVFLTCGTGFGAGLILGGRLYTGACDMAGEIGHIRVTDKGPVGYGKAGSFEGYCSGGGIAQVAKTYAMEQLQMGKNTVFCRNYEELETISAKTVADAANAGDPLALQVYKTCGYYLGRSLAMLVDLLNPEAVVLGSVYARCENLLADTCREVIEKECLPGAAARCKILPAQLGESIGDIAALAVAAKED